MEQMKMDKLEVVPLNYEDAALPADVRELRPAMYVDGDAYCCILGPDPAVGIFGCGYTKDEAVADWQNQLNERISKAPENDEIAQEIIDLKSAGKNEVW